MTTDHMLADLSLVAAFTSVVMIATWAWQKHTRNAGYVDIAWAACLAFAALYYGATGEGSIVARMLTALLGAVWAFRLANHLLARVLHEKEDGRYAFLRTHWKDNQLKFFLFFQGQTLLVLLFSVPFLVAAQNPADGFQWFYVAAFALWVIALGGESVADRQLADFRNNPKNRGTTCRAGLWRYSRHPNYFFEWLHWFSYCLIAFGSAWGWFSLIGPAVMLVTLCWVTGIPFVEAQSLRSRGDDYRRYQQSTSAFVPWFPKKV
jgi:steroid 5-alpha reductase family enzyme